MREVNNYSAIGSGSKYAVAALYLGEEPKKAVEIAIEFDLYCSGDVQIVNKINEMHGKNNN